MTIKTSDQVLIELSAKIESDWGPTPLQNPASNRSDNLVRLVSGWGLSIADLHLALEAYQQRDNLPALEGELLTVAAASRGIFRKTGTLSKAIVIVTGQYCAVLPANSILTDRFGGGWKVQNDIELQSRGAGCSYGYGVVCAEQSGSFSLFDNELVYDNSQTPFIYSATNGLMLEIGGDQETDQSLRNRAMNRGPLARITGTSDAALDAIYAIDGVNFARYQQVETCIGNGWMFVIHGGSDNEICNAIKLHAGLGVCALVGSTNCLADCADVVFQRPCPILACLKVTLNCDCPEQDFEFIKTLILSAAPKLALQKRITAVDIAKLSSSIKRVEIAKKKMPLYACPDTNDLPVIIDPINDAEIIWGTNDPNGICGGVMDCGDPVFGQEIRVKHWQYPIIDLNFIEMERDCSELPFEECVDC